LPAHYARHFPQASEPGRAVGWLEAEIQEWLQRRIEGSRSESDRGQGAVWGHGPIFKLRIARLDEHLQ
jgi:hypothetical protein